MKVYLGHGMGNVLYLMEAADEMIADSSRALRIEEARQKTSSLQKFNGQKWLGELPLQVAWAALELLAATKTSAIRILQGKIPRGNCSPSTCDCPIYTQYNLPYASRIADYEEAGYPLKKEDIHKSY